MKIKTTLLFCALIMFAFSISGAKQNNGAKEVELYGGSRGNISFPHRNHQANLEDCSICHKLFPQQPGAIQNLKDNGKVKRKKIMNTLCIKCHKAEKNAGNKAGPTTCSKCHTR